MLACLFFGRMAYMDFYKFYTRVSDWIVLNGPKYLLGLIVFFIGLWLIRIVRRLLYKALARRIAQSSLVPFIVSLCITGLHVLLFVLSLQVAGIQMTLFAALIAALGVAAGLALSGTLQNLTSGIVILLLKPFRIGDTVIAQGQEGTVSSIEIFYTIVTTFDNRTVIFPNSKLSNEVIINTSRQGTRRIDIELKFNYGVQFEQIKKIIDKTLTSYNNTLKEPIHRIGISSLDPDGYKVIINVWTKAHGYQDTRYILQEKVMENLKSAGIKLPGMS
jgi:small conductance mechanosensitive channel